MEGIENSIPDTSNMYKYWTVKYKDTITASYSRTIILPSSPDFLIIIGDEPLYKLPDRTETDGFWLSFSLNGKVLKLLPGPVMSGASSVERTLYVYAWYK